MRTLMLSAVVIATAGAAAAQYTGPSDRSTAAGGKYTETSIADIVANPQDGMHVIVEGTLVREIGDEMYVLSDGTTEINVEIDRDDFPTTQVADTTTVRIEGEVDTHRNRDADIEADRVTVVN